MSKGPLIFDVARDVLKDGSGIRTTVFFKGCSLKCPWCHNPESIEPGPQIAFYANRCKQCGSCVSACPHAAYRLDHETRIDRALCTNCGLCAQACPSGALTLVGRYYEMPDLVDLLVRDKPFYDASGGGVTLSGGEATLYSEYCGDLIRTLRKRGVNVAIQTNGTFRWRTFEHLILRHVELVMFDVKIADPATHERLTGVNNTQILLNLRMMASERPDLLLVRVPLVPGFTSGPDNCRALAELFRSHGITRVALLPYNGGWLHKAEALGRAPDTRLLHRGLTEAEESTYRGFFPGFELVDMEKYALRGSNLRRGAYVTLPVISVSRSRSSTGTVWSAAATFTTGRPSTL